MATTLATKVKQLYANEKQLELAKRSGLAIVSVAWEDTGRSKGSCWGPNISDMTLYAGDCMPVIRRPNFADVTADLPIESCHVMVGNEEGEAKEMRKIPLRQYLEHIGEYVNRPEMKSLFVAERDRMLLASAQFCVLPVAGGGNGIAGEQLHHCEFNVRLFNYQSSYGSDNPAVLVVMASSHGTSAQIVCGGAQNLYFNLRGRACNFLAERLKGDRKKRGRAVEGKMDADEQERNALFIYQIPLKQKASGKQCTTMDMCYFEVCEDGDSEAYECDDGAFAEEDDDDAEIGSRPKSRSEQKSAGLDHAVLRVGAPHSAFEGIGSHKTLERDPRFPIRCTIQFYQATDTAELPESAYEMFANKIEQVYTTGAATGSLVTQHTLRLTEPQLDGNSGVVVAN